MIDPFLVTSGNRNVNHLNWF